MRVDQCVSVIRVVEAIGLVCLCSSCSHVTEVGGAVRFVRLAVKVVQNEGGLCGSNPAILHDFVPFPYTIRALKGGWYLPTKLTKASETCPIAGNFED